MIVSVHGYAPTSLLVAHTPLGTSSCIFLPLSGSDFETFSFDFEADN